MVFSSLLCAAAPIDREALVTRHHPSVTSVDPWSPFTVGNGGFAMTVDVTGLQSFPEAYRDGIPLSIQSDWGWHSFSNPEGYQLSDTLEDFSTGDRDVSYPTNQTTAAGQWLRSNPHRLGLGRIGFEFTLEDGSIAALEDITEIHQELNLWTGEIHSTYQVGGKPVKVITAVHPDRDEIAVQIDSELMTRGAIRVRIGFPYGSDAWGIEPEDWTQSTRHQSAAFEHTGAVDLITTGGPDKSRQRLPQSVTFTHTLDENEYRVYAASDGELATRREAPHQWILQLQPQDGNHWSGKFLFTLPRFENGRPEHQLSDNAQPVLQASRQFWRRFWTDGAAVDFSGSTDPRAAELERRIILSQYLTAVQCAGDMPPQETGLTFNSWYGVAHLEMHWWHGTHFAQWGRFELLERSLPWYQTILPQARAIAERQGYAGVRWPKMVDRAGHEKPSAIAPLLLWQQPHAIYFAELAWRQNPTPATLATYREIVAETAAFMADFPLLNPATGQLDLGPPMIPAQESYDPRTTKNPPFELAYWQWGLRTAQAWRERLGQERDPHWDVVLAQLAPYPEYEDVYATADGAWNMIDHPSVLGAFGMLPGDDIDRERMRRTLHRVMQEQDWGHTWGWDYPLIALTAARLGETALAIDALLLDQPKNTYLPNGHNYQDDRLRIYLPGNGALLTAVALMAGGWDGAPAGNAPGFPADGTWVVRAEGFHRLP
ncbi:hypothetical protein [Synoicihabitans lomoniglobus]|uniref:Glycoside hydrolase family 65 n=1 Tax=Synoicihabitans lomoniglobus TaxID=2909285 RepID=A0AAE9ZUN8_9BACT|nr:hypothetical protein [Opitutaceae bacterium LMO-M01]WED63641.1 hypothetical protein PXH66_14990 [Opitutaceae bacterium LMO-M01]